MIAGSDGSDYINASFVQVRNVNITSYLSILPISAVSIY